MIRKKVIYRFIDVGFCIQYRPSICRWVVNSVEISGREKLGNKADSLV